MVFSCAFRTYFLEGRVSDLARSLGELLHCTVAGVHCCHGGGRESLPEVAYQSSKLLPRWCSAVCGNLLIEPRAGHFTILFGRQEVSDLALLIAAVFKWLVS